MPWLGFYFDRGKMDVKNEGAKPLTIRWPGERCRDFRALEIKLDLLEIKLDL